MLLARLQGTALLCAIFAIGCGDDDSNQSADAAPNSADAQPGAMVDGGALADANSTAFALSSGSIQEGGVIPTLFTCQGDNISPALAWGNPPADTQGFAVVFTDVSIGFLHSAIWNIPSDRLELPEDVEKVFAPTNVLGARQPDSYAGTRGYAGPCPGNPHTYEFRLHAVNVGTLSGLDQQSTRAEVVTAIEAASIGSVTLSASFDPDNP